MNWRAYLNASARAEEKSLKFREGTAEFQKWHDEARRLLELAKRG